MKYRNRNGIYSEFNENPLEILEKYSENNKQQPGSIFTELRIYGIYIYMYRLNHQMK